ncbi:DUF433 domain-containing protein [Pseudanabaena minima]|uniref:DUF433 domain-containing protein n=1 Tax=Pseudanabaena minima TaxID=890415 RepID=UPI003DA9BA4F
MRTNTLTDSITIDTEIQHGKPVLKGTRIPVAIIIGSLAGGMSYEEVIQEYAVTRDQILVALTYFAELLSYETVYPMEKVS